MYNGLFGVIAMNDILPFIITGTKVCHHLNPIVSLYRSWNQTVLEWRGQLTAVYELENSRLKIARRNTIMHWSRKKISLSLSLSLSRCRFNLFWNCSSVTWARMPCYSDVVLFLFSLLSDYRVLLLQFLLFSCFRWCWINTIRDLYAWFRQTWHNNNF